MKVHEYQAKDLLSQYGVPIPKGRVASTPEEARRVATELGGHAVIKAQVHAGGRGKAGGIKIVSSPGAAQEVAASLLGHKLITAQTGPQGAPVSKVLVEEVASVARELYLAVAVDRVFGGPVIIASPAGGMAIEEVAASNPERIFREPVDLVVGLQPFQGRRLARALDLGPDLTGPATQLMASLCRLFVEKDCSLVEINPLAVTADNRLLAVDAKVNFEDDALFRHRQLADLADLEQEDPQEAEASKASIAYVKLEGQVGCLVNGAGLAMATMDLVQSAGASPANFLDVGGGATEGKVAQAVRIMLSDPKVRLALVNIFGGILRCDIAARGIVQGYRQMKAQTPLVVRMLGTNEEEGRAILAESGLNVVFAKSLSEAISRLKTALQQPP